MSIIDSLFIALGFKADTSGLKDFKGQVESARESIFTFGNALKALATGYAVKQIAEIGSTFEQNKIQIAGFLSSLGLSSDFNAGLEDASRLMTKITADAALLPGEAEDYIAVFKTNAAFLKTAMPGASPERMAAFTNQFTAVAKSIASNLDSGTIARESSMLLGTTGRAGGHIVLWQRLLPFLMQVKGQANLTAQSFNAMTQPARVKLLQEAFVKLQPMLDASSKSFDAMWGAAVSAMKQLTRLATAKIFEGMKSGLDKLNSMFFKADYTLTETGQKIVDTLKRISGYIVQLVEDGAILVGWLDDLWHSGRAAKIALTGIAIGIYGVQRALKGGLLGALLLIIDDLVTFKRGGDSVIGLLLERFPIAMRVAGVALGVLGAAILAFQVKAAVAFIALKVQALAALIPIAIANAAAWAPFLLAIVAIGALTAAGYELYKNWDIVLEGLKGLWTGFVDHIKKEVNNISDTLGVSALSQALGLGSGHLTTSTDAANARADALTAQNASLYKGQNIYEMNALKMSGADAGAGATAAAAAPVQSTVTTTNNFKIDGSKDPKATADAVKKILDLRDRQLARNGAGTVGL